MFKFLESNILLSCCIYYIQICLLNLFQLPSLPAEKFSMTGLHLLQQLYKMFKYSDVKTSDPTKVRTSNMKLITPQPYRYYTGLFFSQQLHILQ